VYRLFNLSLGLDADIPVASRLTDCDVLGGAFDDSAVSVLKPADFREVDTAIVLIDLELLGVWIPEGVTLSFLFEPGEVCTFGKEVFICTLQILQGVLKRMYRGFRKPFRLGCVPPFGKQFRHSNVANEFITGLAVFLL